jgi:hypothetical protein
MSVLGPTEIKLLLKEAAELLTTPADQEIMDRLVASIDVTNIADWDRKLIGAMLAKAGKISDAEKVIGAIPVEWEKADALMAAGLALFDAKQDVQAKSMLEAATKSGINAQEQGTDQDRQCGSGVLADISEIYAARGMYEDGEKLIEAISDPIRAQRAMDRLKELRGDIPEPRDDY